VPVRLLKKFFVPFVPTVDHSSAVVYLFLLSFLNTCQKWLASVLELLKTCQRSNLDRLEFYRRHGLALRIKILFYGISVLKIRHHQSPCLVARPCLRTLTSSYVVLVKHFVLDWNAAKSFVGCRVEYAYMQ
jgi:hypothetical protein